jgi:hypothetical protein
MAAHLEHELEIELPANTPEQMLAALAARDRLCGQSLTLELPEDPRTSVEVWIATAEALNEKMFWLGLHAELDGPKALLDDARDAVEEIFAAEVEAGAIEAEQAQLLERRPAGSVTLRAVPEKDEQPQIVIPEWLAPDDAEPPWGFLPFEASGQVWPGPALTEAHARLVIVPSGEELLLYSLPGLPEDGEE